jgi:hypothetical protein
MGQLGRRDAPRLLSKINGKTHAMADGHRDPLPQTPKAPRIHIPEEVKVYLDRLSASPTSSSGGSLPSSADIPTTLFKTGLEKETKAKPLRDIGNGRRGNRSTTTAQKPARKGTESPDSKKLGDWGVERKPKKKPMKKILVMKSIPNSAKISNIHAPLQSKATNSRFAIVELLQCKAN